MQAESCFDLQGDLEYMTEPSVAVETLVWSTVWVTNPHRDEVLHKLVGRLDFARMWADEVFRACRSLREIYYIELGEYSEHFETGVLFTLSANGMLLQEDKGEKELPV